MKNTPFVSPRVLVPKRKERRKIGGTRSRLTKRNDVNDQDPHLGRNILEVCELDPWPDHQVLLVSRQEGVLEALRGRVTLHVGHAGQEDGHVDGGKEELVTCHTCEDGAVLGRQVDTAHEEIKPLCGCGAEDACTKVVC